MGEGGAQDLTSYIFVPANFAFYVLPRASHTIESALLISWYAIWGCSSIVGRLVLMMMMMMGCHTMGVALTVQSGVDLARLVMMMMSYLVTTPWGLLSRCAIWGCPSIATRL